MTDRHAIGANNPPPFDAHALHIEDLFSVASGSLAAGDITTDEQEAALDDLMDQFRQAKKDADAQRASEKKPHDDAAKAVQTKWKPLLDRCDAAINEIKERLTPYRTAKQIAKDELARRVREEAEAAVAEAREALKSSDDLETRFAAEQGLKTASKLTAVANRADRQATGLRTHWEAEITDRKAALLHMIQIHPDRFTALIQQIADEEARGARGAIPGVVFHERKRAA
jgi:polyhydroxyalkanoate synthesis regulator phasin